ncbi:hypothetical protein THAOC_09589 [Thalassiosira oceanica]|uniref:Uncharacterized protein n=1 Tax=Thalassiosira oceanica TaxID=159749 RepID=K0SSD2_THAOC|nr:hypothetical protein THAOC_09589 [Thalassiosira oceanica]|eukprot:EJK69183.1 hypothetical protein THAOC_09589 [Thalassiosira oceanica]
MALPNGHVALQRFSFISTISNIDSRLVTGVCTQERCGARHVARVLLTPRTMSKIMVMDKRPMATTYLVSNNILPENPRNKSP